MLEETRRSNRKIVRQKYANVKYNEARIPKGKKEHTYNHILNILCRGRKAEKTDISLSCSGGQLLYRIHTSKWMEATLLQKEILIYFTGLL